MTTTRSRTTHQAVIAVLAGALMLPIGVLAGQHAFADEGGSTPSPDAEILQGLRADLAVGTDELVRRNVANGTWVRLEDCPDAKEFFGRADVQRFYAENFGPIDTPQILFRGECPSITDLERGYADAQNRVN